MTGNNLDNGRENILLFIVSERFTSLLRRFWCLTRVWFQLLESGVLVVNKGLIIKLIGSDIPQLFRIYRSHDIILPCQMVRMSTP